MNPDGTDNTLDGLDQDCDGTDGTPLSTELLDVVAGCRCSATGNPLGGWWATLGVLGLLMRRRDRR